MRKLLILVGLLSLFSSCIKGETPRDVVERYLTALENEQYQEAYKLIDKISQKYVSPEKFEEYWKQRFAKEGVPDSHRIYMVKEVNDTMMADYRWFYPDGKKVDYALKLTKTVDQGVWTWRVKFLKYRKVEKPLVPKKSGQ